MEQTLYTVEDIQIILGISRTKAYEIIKQVYKKQEPFRVLKIGNQYRIPVKSFTAWINGE